MIRLWQNVKTIGFIDYFLSENKYSCDIEGKKGRKKKQLDLF